MKNLRQIKGDASHRKFFRKKTNKNKSIIVFTKKDKNKNLVIYDAINKIMIKNNILAPYLLKENLNKNFIEIQDFGDETFFKILNKKGSNKFYHFKKIVKVLEKIQLIKDRKIKNFKNKNYLIPKYDKKILIAEANLFCDWYAKENLSKKQKYEFFTKFKKIIRKLSSKLKLKNNVFVHRDFHVSNLMLVKNQIGVLDSQDALIGNRAYDLASLIDDVRLKTSKKLKDRIYNFYIKKQKKLNDKNFKNDFQILSILRNLKIIGIFTRLALRDGKKAYLKMIPYAWKLIYMRIKENKNFQDLENLLNKNFKN